MTVLASRAEAGTVFPKTLQLTQGATYSGIVAELDLGICSHRMVTSQTTLVNWGDGAIARDTSVGVMTTGAFVLHGMHTYAASGAYTISIDVETTCGPPTYAMVDYASGSVTAIVTSTAMAPRFEPPDLDDVGRVLLRLARPFAARPNATARIPLGLDLYRPVPATNPLTNQNVALGRRLFRDRRLSRDGSLSCAGCHDPQRAFTDGRTVSVGVGGVRGARNVPMIVNRAWGQSFFWDGRIRTLEEQVLKPIEDPKEMNLPVADAARRVGLSVEDLSRTLASYVRSIVSGNSPYDRFVNGDRTALSTVEQAGLQIFRSKGNCTACHVGPTFTDERLHNTGIAWAGGAGRTGEAGRAQGAGEFLDAGRAAVTGKLEDRGAFKTPTLREVARTAPYMHDGSKPTLDAVVDFYNDGGRPNPNLDPELRPLHLTIDEKQAVVAFLKSLSGAIREGRP
jgi:cytochrome c peroxidase